MKRARGYHDGFSAGTLAALAVLTIHGDVGSRAYVEILTAGGAEQVIAYAKREGAMRWSGLSKYARQCAESDTDDTAPDGLEG